MNERQEDIEDFINGIKVDLMEIYNVSEEEAILLLKNFKLRELIDEFGETVAHYPSQELAKMAYDKTKGIELNPREINEYICNIVSHMMEEQNMKPKDAFNLIINQYNFFEMIEETNGDVFHYDSRYWSEEMYKHRNVAGKETKEPAISDEEEYFQMLREEFQKLYDLNEDEIANLLERSGFMRLFKEDKTFYYHYQPEYIANMIYNSQQNKK